MLCSPAVAEKNSVLVESEPPPMLLRAAISKPFPGPLMLRSTYLKWASRWRKALTITLSSVVSKTHGQAVGFVSGQSSASVKPSLYLRLPFELL